jgi:hypothetical protein
MEKLFSHNSINICIQIVTAIGLDKLLTLQGLLIFVLWFWFLKVDAVGSLQQPKKFA